MNLRFRASQLHTPILIALPLYEEAARLRVASTFGIHRRDLEELPEGLVLAYVRHRRLGHLSLGPVNQAGVSDS